MSKDADTTTFSIVDFIDVDRLLNEFKGIGLGRVDAYRAAFCTIAVHRGWNAAQIGRYLGVSRTRVGQKIERLHRYTEERDVPFLTELLNTATPATPSSTPDFPIGFPSTMWEDGEFSMGLLKMEATCL